jgi:predicted Zn finger-like uncharacterized protein
MLINCNSCQKKFVVPDSAITESGRLVQCGSCNVKWTQYPVKEKARQETKKSKLVKIKKNKKKVILYSEQYLKKKHGLVIRDSIEPLESKTTINKKTKGFGFYSYMITIIIFFIAIFGILNLSKDILIFNYPATELYFNYLYEVLYIIKITFTEFVNQLKN